MEILVENFNEIVYGFQVVQVIIADVNAYTEIEARVSSIYDFEVTELKADQ